MAGSAYGRMARPLAAAVAAVPLFAGPLGRRPQQCDDKPTPPAFVTAQCTKNVAHTKDTRLVSLALPESWNPQGPIANVLVRAAIAGPAETAPTVVARPYNPLSAESGKSITLLVKRYEDAKMGSKLHGLEVGDTVEVKGPNKQWSLEKGKYKHFGMLAGGTGITPLVQASEYILRNDTAAVTMVTFNKTAQDVLLREHLAQLQAAFPGRFKVVHVVESGAAGTDLEGSAATSAKALKELLPPPAPGVLVMVCGRPQMTAAVAGPKTPDYKQGDLGGLLKDLGYSAEQVWKV